MCKNIEHQKNAYLDLFLVIFEDHLIFKLHFIRTIWLKMCLFVIRDAKNMLQENRESNVHAFQPTQSQCLLCSYTHASLSVLT